MLLGLLPRRRLGAVVAFLIAAGGLGAVLLHGYVDVGSFGPLRNMYDPIWCTEKTINAIAEAVVAVGALALLPAVPRHQTLRVELWGGRFRCPLRGGRPVLGPPAPWSTKYHQRAGRGPQPGPG